ncbi:MAG: phosphate ABC transporter permease PstA [Actinomycetota bacterium]|jgi:phosphate transport system permease protein|nr:phosphate ABC transporter permease PstA [Actinomycetota bacterium]
MKKRYLQQKIFYGLLLFCTLIVVAFVLGIILFLIIKGARAISFNFIFGSPENGMREGGIFPAILGTLYLMLGTIIFALPIGIFAAIYINEYAGKSKITRIIRLSIINMSGVPSVVFGLFGLGFFVLFLRFGKSILAGSLTLALMILPIIITSTEEALKSVSDTYRQASLALGATKWQTIYKVVLPQALPGIITGSVIGIGRAAGETAPIIFTVAAFSQPGLPKSIFDQAMALPYHLYVLATQVTNPPEDMQWGTALVLLLLVLFFSVIGSIIRVRQRLKKRELS